jgi:hypothetical protein
LKGIKREDGGKSVLCSAATWIRIEENMAVPTVL